MGRTARAGRAGKSITMVCQYDVEIYQKIEAAIGKKLEEWPHEKDQIMVLKERVDEAKRIAEQEIKVSPEPLETSLDKDFSRYDQE